MTIPQANAASGVCMPRPLTGTVFRGAGSTRQLRALEALLNGRQSRESLDRIAGCSNAPDLVAQLRRRGLQIPCDKAKAVDRDGREVRIGIYSLTKDDKAKVRAWMVGADVRASSLKLTSSQ